jgi:ribonuclease BN (tRNA processing enzyme)
MRAGVVDLCRGCDLVIYDTMFRMEQYLARPHWGHSCPEHAVELVEEAGASCLVLYHHAPERSDDELDRELERIQRSTRVRVLAAAEGMELDLASGQLQVRS